MTVPHFAFLILINLIWGSMFVVATIGLTTLPPVLFTALRFLLLTVVLAPFLRVPAQLIVPLIRVGLVMGVGMYLSLYYALYLAENTAAIAIFGQLEVPFAVILGVLVLKESLTSARAGGIIIAMIGAAIIGFDPAAFDDLPALFWMTVSSAFFAITMIMVRRLETVHPLTITAWLSVVSAPILMVVSLIIEANHLAAASDAGWLGWGCLLYTAFFGSLVAHSGMYLLLQRYPVSLIAPFTLLSPVFATVGGVVFLEDVLTWPLMIGGGLILAGVAWVDRSRHQTPS